MMKWINVLRPGCGLIMVLLLISGFNIIKQPVSPYLIVALFCITSTAMLWNDLYDKEIDTGKGKNLASQHPRKLFYYSITLTVLSLIFSILVLLDDMLSGLLCLALLTVSIIYNYVQNIPVVKNLSISLSTGAVLLFPMLKSGSNTTLWILLLTTIIIISIREYIKDVEDMEIDKGKKQTLALILNSQIKTRDVKTYKLILTLSIVVVSLFGFIY